MLTAQKRLSSIIPSWYDLLTQWSQDGSLVAAAIDALMLDSSNAKPDAKGQLQSLTSQWSAGNFKSLPEIVLLSNAEISGAQGAYAISTGKIYLNADWLLTADEDWIRRVLTEELGHSLDAHLNLMDTPGDEGEYFSGLLWKGALSDAEKQTLRRQGNDGVIKTATSEVEVEQSFETTTGIRVVLRPGFSGSEVRNHSAFAAIGADGSVITWGSSIYGGDSSSVTQKLSGRCTEIFSNTGAFAALMQDGSVVTWGFEYGGDSSSVSEKLTGGVVRVFSSPGAFAALKSDGSVVTWGGPQFGGDSSYVSSQLTNGVKSISSTDNAFAALKHDGSIVTWGEASSGGDKSAVADFVTSGVSSIVSTGTAFAALKSDGSVVTWGAAYAGGNSSSVAESLSSNCVRLYSNRGAFSALKSDGSVASWGSAESGGESTIAGEGGLPVQVGDRLTSSVKEVISTNSAFAALKTDGSVVTWGTLYRQPQPNTAFEPFLTGGISRVFASSNNFAAIREDGSVFTWPNADIYIHNLTASIDNAVDIASSLLGFAVLRADGSVTSWYCDGGPIANDPSFLPEQALSSGVIRLFSSDYGFTALKADGSAVSWGIQINDGVGERYTKVFSEVLATLCDPFSDERIIFSDSGSGTLGAISGDTAFEEGVILAAGTITGDPDGNGVITGYQWYFNDTAIIVGGNSSTYKTSATGHGNYKVAVTYVDDQQYSTTLTSTNQAIGRIDNGNAIVTVSGFAAVGSILSAAITADDPDGNGSFTYQWQSLSGSTWSNIANATAATYTLTSNELNKPVRMLVTSTDSQGFPATITSNVTSAVTAPPDAIAPTMTDISVQGNTVILTFSEKISSTGLANGTFGIKVAGIGRSVSSTNYDATNQNKVTLTLSGTTAPTPSQSLQVSYQGTSPNIVKDLSGNALATFSNRSADSFFSGASVSSLYADYTNLTLTGTSAINATGNGKNNGITGNQANNTINGAGGADVLTGLGGADTFVYTTLANSLLGSPSGYTFDRITDFTIGQDKIDGPKTVGLSQFQRLGAVATLDQAGLQAVLTTTKFVANGAASFTCVDGGTTRTFVALNNNVAGFDVTKDAVLEITGYSGVLTGLSIV